LVIKALDLDWIRIRIGIQPLMLDPDPVEMNADPQPCIYDLPGCSFHCQIADPIVSGFSWVLGCGSGKARIVKRKKEKK
jgi:hypothetical protein